MAKYDTRDTVYPTVGEVIQFIAVKSGLVATDSQNRDEVYVHLKLFAREQRGKDFRLLDEILDELQDRLERDIAPPGISVIIFELFRRFLERYKVLILRARVNAWTREQFVEGILIPEFIVPYAAWLLKRLNEKPFDFLSIVELLRSVAPLKVAFTHFLLLSGKSWSDLPEVYQGKARSYGGTEPEHDPEDKRKLIHKWGTGKGTPSFETCLELLDGLGLAEFSGIVFWTWISRFLQKVDIQYRNQIADAIECNAGLPSPKAFAERVTGASDALSRPALSRDTVKHLRMLTTLLFYNRHRHQGDKARVETLLAKVRESVGELSLTKFYVTWLEARYHLYCRDLEKALEGYEQAFNEGMYRDCQAETCILPEWAAIAQKADNAPALKRIDSRMKMLGLYPKASADEVAATRLKAFHNNLGAGLCFHESFSQSD